MNRRLGVSGQGVLVWLRSCRDGVCTALVVARPGNMSFVRHRVSGMHAPKGVVFGIATALLIAATVGVTLALSGDDDPGVSGTVSDSTPTSPEPIPGTPKFAQALRSCMEGAGFKGVYLAPTATPSGTTTVITGKAPNGERVSAHGFETPGDARAFARVVQSQGFNDDLALLHDGKVVAIPGPFAPETLALLGTCFE